MVKCDVFLNSPPLQNSGYASDRECNEDLIILKALTGIYRVDLPHLQMLTSSQERTTKALQSILQW